MRFTQDDNYIFMYKVVCEYYHGGLSMREAENMPCDEFMLTYKNAIIEKLMQTEQGREDIKRYYRLTIEDEEDSDSNLTELFGNKVKIE